LNGIEDLTRLVKIDRAGIRRMTHSCTSREQERGSGRSIVKEEELLLLAQSQVVALLCLLEEPIERSESLS
jgi:hypothetical protein